MVDEVIEMMKIIISVLILVLGHENVTAVDTDLWSIVARNQSSAVLFSPFRHLQLSRHFLIVASKVKWFGSRSFLITREAAWYIISVVYVCLYVCMYVCQMITVESLDVGSSYLRMPYLHALRV